MYTIKFTNAYKKSYKLMKKRGLNIALLDEVVDKLRQGKQDFSTYPDRSPLYLFPILYKSFTLNALIAFRTAIIITPTSAKIASHILAKPTAPRKRQPNLITSANTIF